MTVPDNVWTIVAVSITNALLTAIGIGVRKTYAIIKHFAVQHEAMLDDLRATMAMVDIHSEALVRCGSLKPDLARRLTRTHEEV